MVFLERKGQHLLLRHPQVMISHRKSKEVIKIAWFGHTSLLLFKKKRTFNRHFSRPAETDPYAHHIVQKQPLRKYSIQVLQDFEILVLLLECIPGLSKTKDDFHTITRDIHQ